VQLAPTNAISAPPKPTLSKMAKKSASAATAAAAAESTTTSSITSASSPTTSAKDAGAATQWNKVIANITTHYVKETPQRTKLLDVFMVFLVVVGALQFLYCVLAGNYPFNAFLSGFSATVGQFVLAASLRIQTNAANKSQFPDVSPERAFADFVGCSLILHFFCINFIN
ncbi:hypothetical protein TD95_001867, partial [Thielaviopsis punctulata]